MGCILKINFDTLYLLIGTFSPFTFRTIIDRYAFSAVLLFDLFFFLEIFLCFFLVVVNANFSFALKESPLIFPVVPSGHDLL